MARYVIVMPPEQKYIRLQQACRKKGEADCDLTKVYFCPNLCYETHIMDFSKTAAAQ